ncbi:MAG TPA: MFS transporter [Rhodocyclaceae bacterium]|nr:MFS transporter [Rhodocyclaceae bacterium]
MSTTYPLPAAGEPTLIGAAPAQRVSSKYAWLVFLLTFGLMLSDFMSRQVLNAVFPILKQSWSLSDTQLGSLNSIVALMVGLLALPLSIVSDSWGHRRAILAMAVLWSLATLWCGLAHSYHEMLVARFFVGVGEAAFGSVGVAILLRVFPEKLRATVVAAFMSGGVLGTVVGMALGGVLASRLGWRWAFLAMAIFGLVLAGLYYLFVTEGRIAGKQGHAPAKERLSLAVVLRHILGRRTLWFAYSGGAFQMFILASLAAWLPSYLNRVYAFPIAKAAAISAVFLLLSAAGTTVCGNISDRLSVRVAQRKWMLAISFAAFSSAALFWAFRLPPGSAQLAVLAVGVLVVTGSYGPIGAVIGRLVPGSTHASAYGLMNVVNNLLGIAIGPFLTGVLADAIGLGGALQWVPVVGFLSVSLLYVGSRLYAEDVRRHDQA